MSCQNCNCGKADNKIKSINPVIKEKEDIAFFNRLYLLGFIAARVEIVNIEGKDSVDLQINKISDYEDELFGELLNTFPDDLEFLNNKKTIRISNEPLFKFINENLLSSDENLQLFFNKISVDSQKYFWRGYFDAYAKINQSKDNGFPRIILDIKNVALKTKFLEFSGFSECDVAVNNLIFFKDIAALDIMDILYSNTQVLSNNNNYSIYLDYCKYVSQDLTVKFIKSLPEAVTPSKARASDSGYDLTLIKKSKTIGDVEFYDTGIQVAPPAGYYFDLVPRSSISKTGYMLCNSVGVVDASYRGNILVALRKIDKNAADLELPVKLVQLIPRQIANLQFVEFRKLNTTQRGEGGFGSSDEKQC